MLIGSPEIDDGTAVRPPRASIDPQSNCKRVMRCSRSHDTLQYMGRLMLSDSEMAECAVYKRWLKISRSSLSFETAKDTHQDGEALQIAVWSQLPHGLNSAKVGFLYQVLCFCMVARQDERVSVEPVNTFEK